MTVTAEARYLDLLKRTLSFTLWPEPAVPIDYYSYKWSRPKQTAVRLVAGLLRRARLELVADLPFSEADRTEGRIWPMYADTMIGLKRLENIQACIETVLRENVPGDLIETGVWRGGGAIFMRAVLAAFNVTDRRVFVADSFEGLPRPDEQKYPADKGDLHYLHPILSVSRVQVERNFQRYDLLDDQVVFLHGWFKDTLPTAPIEQLSVLRLDGDMYESTMDALRPLYPKLVQGGFCIVDDYHLANCRAAVNEYRAEHDITAPLVQIDSNAVYWRVDR